MEAENARQEVLSAAFDLLDDQVLRFTLVDKALKVVENLYFYGRLTRSSTS